MSETLAKVNSVWILSQVLTTLGFLLALVLLAHLLASKRSTASTIAWLLIIILAPYVGVPLYLMFGGRKIRRMAGRKEQVYHNPRRPPEETTGLPAERVLQSFGLPPSSAGNRVSTVTSGEDAYRCLVDLIDRAERSIHITTYILGRDSVGKAIVDRLARRAAEGIAVRLLLDDVGSWWLGRKFVTPLLESGAHVAYFMPILHLPFRGRTNLRNHRKIVVVDDQHALTGGMNLAYEYMGPWPDPARWQDFSLTLSGPAVADLANLFSSDWKFATGEDLRLSHDPPRAEVHDPDGSIAQVVASGPDVAGDPLYESLVTAVFTAQRRVWVVTPYFIPDETLARALELAARRGVDVRLVVPAHSNHAMADLARASYLRQIHDAGGHILLYTPGMIHAKVVLVDYDLAVVGSANMDMRSLFLNYEVAVYLYSLPQIEATATWMRSIMVESVSRLPMPGRLSELTENVVRLLSPLL